MKRDYPRRPRPMRGVVAALAVAVPFWAAVAAAVAAAVWLATR